MGKRGGGSNDVALLAPRRSGTSDEGSEQDGRKQEDTDPEVAVQSPGRSLLKVLS